jgi:hypothetical protein
MKQLIIFLAIFLSGTLELYSQSDFRNGYIVKNNDEIIYGLIDYKGNKANAKKCVFKKEVDSEKQEFTPEEIKAYRFIDSKYYISKSIKQEDKENLLFVEYLINGTVDIFYYRDHLGEHYLLDLGENELYELKNEEKEVYVNNTRLLEETKEYIGILKYSFSQSPSISQKAENVSLNHKSLIKIAHDYHKEICADEVCIIYEKKLPKKIIKFGALVGVNAMTISEIGTFSEELYYLDNSNYSTAIYPSLGMFFKINMPDANERFYFQYEGTFNYSKLTTTNSYIEPFYKFNYINSLVLAQSAFCNAGIVRYEFPKGKIRPTFQAGGFVNYFLTTEFNRDLLVKFSTGDTYFTNESNESPFSKFDYGINLGVGAVSEMSNKKEISIDLRYQRGFGLIPGYNSNNLSLNIGFQIGK